ncbi:hypothetical protein LDC_0104 [sediment metagenome]|uniref:Uncharacterized protein n=1 Tax=sediment metagenome TaxID=749907 RepID=D9PF26_9ZZZZ
MIKIFIGVLFCGLFAEAGDLLSLDTKVSYVSKYMWRGFDLLEGDPSIQPEATLSFSETGLYLGVWASYGTKSKWDEWDEWDFYGGYATTFYENMIYAVEADFGYTFFHYPNQNKYIDSQEIAVNLKFPSLLKLTSTRFIPYTGVSYSFAAHKNEVDQRGYWLKLGLNMEQKISSLNENPFLIYIETFCNDGAGSMQVESGFSHIATGIKTTFEVWGLGFTPSVNYQETLEDSVNKDNDFWYTLTASKAF